MSVRSTIARLGGLCLMAGVLAATAPAGPANAAPEPVPAPEPAAVEPAAIPGLVRVSTISVSNSLNKSATVSCPVGKRVYSAGQITGGVGNVYMDDVTPSDDLRSVRVTGQENGAYAGNWTVTAYAVCGNHVLNLQRISFQSPTNGLSPKTVAASCPAGTRLYGLGGEVTGGGGNVFMYRMVPNAGLTGVSISAAENAADAAWSLTGYAICGNAPASLQRVQAATPASSASPKHVGVACPAGKSLIGAGGAIVGRTGKVVLDDLTPSVALNRVDTAAYENGAVPTNWALAAYGICA